MAYPIAKHGHVRNRVVAPFQAASDAQKDIFLKHFRESRNVAVACQAAGIRRNVYDHAMASDEEFREAHREIDEFYVDKLELIAYDLGMRQDVPMVKFLLQALRPEKYGPKAKVEMTHTIQSVEQIRSMSDEDILAAFEEMKIEVDG